MAKPLSFNDQEIAYLLAALDLAEKSARRAQNGKIPELKAIYKKQETDYVALKIKLQN